jgi:RimJ/RimL family protein N-acetyltransferase
MGPRRRVDLETERFRLRSLQSFDASEAWLSWAADPEVMGPLNMVPQRMSRQNLVEYIAQFDDLYRFLVGIFVKQTKRHIGFFMIDVNSMHRNAAFNVLIGDKEYWGQSVINEARAALLDYFFKRRDIEKAYGTPLARNFSAVFNYKTQGWRLEGILREHCRSVVDGGRLDQYQFGITRAEWLSRDSTGSKS